MRKSYLPALVGLILGMACLVVAVSPAALCRAACGHIQACVTTGPCSQQQPVKTPRSVLWGNGVGKGKLNKAGQNPASNAQTSAK